jgi:hypothetical protein
MYFPWLPPHETAWLVACEYSGRVRDALIAHGVPAISCDWLPSEAPGPHIVGDVRPYLKLRWLGVIAHPPCTYLANSGVRWLGEDPKRWPKMFDAADFFLECLNANAPCVAVENPVMHGYARRLIGLRADFTVQPWQFGDDFKKRTCFWTRGLPRLAPTSTLDGHSAVAAVHLAPPSATRWQDRSRTYPGIAKALAAQFAAPTHAAHQAAQFAARAPTAYQIRG